MVCEDVMGRLQGGRARSRADAARVRAEAARPRRFPPLSPRPPPAAWGVGAGNKGPGASGEQALAPHHAHHLSRDGRDSWAGVGRQRATVARGGGLAACLLNPVPPALPHLHPPSYLVPPAATSASVAVARREYGKGALQGCHRALQQVDADGQLHSIGALKDREEAWGGRWPHGPGRRAWAV